MQLMMMMPVRFYFFKTSMSSPINPLCNSVGPATVKYVHLTKIPGRTEDDAARQSFIGHPSVAYVRRREKVLCRTRHHQNVLYDPV